MATLTDPRTDELNTDILELTRLFDRMKSPKGRTAINKLMVILIRAKHELTS
jgi:hypothetical protein